MLAEDGGYFNAPERGIAYRISGKTWVNNHAHIIKPRDGIDLAFLCRVLENYDVSPFISGSTRAKLTKSQAEKIEIPVPPLAEQKRIAEILDQADNLRRLRQCGIDRLDSLSQAIFYEMFGDPKRNTKQWTAVKLGEVSEFYSGNSLPEGEAFTGQQDGYLLLKVSDLNLPENSREIGSAAGWSMARGSRAGTCPAFAVVFPKRGGAIGTNKKRCNRSDAPFVRTVLNETNLM